MDDLIFVGPVDLEAELDSLAKRYKSAGGLGMDIQNLVGSQADGLIDGLPKPVAERLNEGTRLALIQAMNAASVSRKAVPDQAGWLNRTVSAAMGAAGGFGGLPTALAELPVTTTLLLRVIEGVAVQNRFDPTAESVRFDCVQVFASAGPLSHDDGADIAFLSARLGMSGLAMNTLVARVAPKLATVLGQKVGAQAIPILGAAAGAATNYAYTKYYEEMAHVQFGLRRLAIDADRDPQALIEDFTTRLDRLR